MSLPLLLHLDRQRLRASIRYPGPGPWAGVVLPLALAAGMLWVVGRVASPGVGTPGDAVVFGMFVSGSVAFVMYPILFRADDEALLRRLGMPTRALFAERALRLLSVSLGILLLFLIPFASAGRPLGPPLVVGMAAALAAWGVGLFVLARVALALAGHAPGRAWGLASAGMWDRELAERAPLVWAPLPPFLSGAVAAGWAAAGAVGWGRVVVVGLVAAALAAAGARWYERARPRFAPMVIEMAFEPPPPTGAGELQVGGGVAGLLPRGAAVVWARDAVVAGRRFAWAERVVWPVAIGSVIALARWGEVPATRAWVAAGAVLVLVLQGAAAVGLGRIERARSRWVDRLVGIGGRARLLGRWAWGLGRSLWLTVPLALAWGWWSGAGAGWGWLLLGGVAAGVASAASLWTAGWR